MFSGICLAGVCCLGALWGTPAMARPPAKKTEKKTKKQPALKKAIEIQRLNKNPFGALGGESAITAFSATGLAGPNFRKADAAYARGEWARAAALYQSGGDGGVLSPQHRRFGPSRAMSRLGHACQAQGLERCAIDAAKAIHETGSRMGIAMGGRSSRSRVARALPNLIAKRRRALKALERGDVAKADRLFVAVHRQDPRCPGRSCPPFVLRELSAAHARQGRFESAQEALKAWLKMMPKHPERRAMRRQMKAWARAAAQKKADDAAALEASRVRIPTAGKRAPWFTTAKRTPHARFRGFAYGGDVGVAHLRVGALQRWMGMREGSPIVDGLAIPKGAKWVGVGGDELIYYATKAGALHRASLDKARAPFTPIGSAPDAIHWDAQGSTVVASNRTQIWIWSKGATAPLAYTHPETISTAWTRADGVVVFGDSAAAYTSADGGRTWTRTALGDMRALHRHGQQVFQKPWAPMRGEFEGVVERAARCAQGELTADLKWVVPTDLTWRHGDGWAAVFSVGTTARAPASLPDGAGHSAVAGGADVVAEIAKCRADPKAYFDKRGGGGGIGSGRPRCAGLGCLSAPPTPASPVRFGLLGDGRCAAEGEAAILTPEVVPRRRFSRAPRLCSGLAQAGTLVRITTDGLDPVPPITNCAPEMVHSLAGVGVVSCVQSDGSRALVVLDDTGAPRERIAVEGVPGHMGIVADGTIAVALNGKASTTAAIRAPVALGAPDAWRVDTVSDAQAWRPAPGGRGIALTPGSKGEPVFTAPRVQRTRVDGERDYARWTGARLASIQACHARAFAADPSLAGRLFVTLRINDAGVMTALGTENRLTGDSAGLLACVSDVLERDVHPKAAATEIAYLTFGGKNNSLRAWLTAPGKPPTALTEDVLFERPLDQIVARDDGSIAVTPPSYPPKTCTLPKAGALLCPKAR